MIFHHAEGILKTLHFPKICDAICQRGNPLQQSQPIFLYRPILSHNQDPVEKLSDRW